MTYAVVEIKLFQNYFRGIGLLQLNIFDIAEIILK